LLASGPLVSQTESGSLSDHEVAVPEIGHGTLVVAIASPKFIVVVTDSRKTWSDGSHADNSKKLFRVGRKRVLAIAGLASAIPQVPGLTEEIASILEDEIAYSAGPSSAAGWTDIDDRYWNDPLPPEFPPSWPQDQKQRLLALEDMPHYIWWQMTAGPVESVVDIGATYAPSRPLETYRLAGLLAGFKDYGEAKLEYMVMIPTWDTTLWGLPRVGLGQMWERVRTKDKLIYKTMGETQLADRVLEGDIDEALMSLIKRLPLNRQFAGASYRRHNGPNKPRRWPSARNSLS
jgi:hypothetical protein